MYRLDIQLCSIQGLPSQRQRSSIAFDSRCSGRMYGTRLSPNASYSNATMSLRVEEENADDVRSSVFVIEKYVPDACYRYTKTQN